jgi:Protein of unknown function (DUF4230)
LTSAVLKKPLWSLVILLTGMGLGVVAAGAAGRARRASDRLKPSGDLTSLPYLTHAAAGPSIEQVRRLSSLVTTRVEVADVQVTDLRGQTGGVRAILIIQGDFLIGVDLSKATFESLDPVARKAVLVLAPPAVSSPRLDQAKTQLLSVNTHGLWHVVPGDAGRTAAVEEAYARAQEVITTVASRPELAEMCRRDSEQSLDSFFTAAGWTVSIRWVDR